MMSRSVEPQETNQGQSGQLVESVPERFCDDASDAGNVCQKGQRGSFWQRLKRDRLDIFDTPWPWLGYLIIYFFPWFFQRPSEQVLVLTVIVMPIFLVLYIIGFKTRGPQGLWYAYGVALLGLIGAPIAPTSSVFIVYAAAMSSRLRPRKLAIIGLISVLLPFTILSFVLEYPTIFILTGLFFGIMVGGGGIAEAEMRAKNVALRESREESRVLAIAAERERIARDMHDVLGHSLSMIAVKADLGAKLLAKADNTQATQQAQQELQDIHQSARQALADVRSTITGMKSTTLVAEVAAARKALTAADVDLNFMSEAEALPQHLEETIAMVIREAVTNVVRHAGAARCTIKLLGDDDALVLVIEDDGRTADAHSDVNQDGAVREGNGLKGMRARVEAVSGQFHALVRDGFRIEAVLPLPAAPNREASQSGERESGLERGVI